MPKRDLRPETPGERLITDSQLTPEFAEFVRKVLEVSATAINAFVDLHAFYDDVDHSNFTEDEHRAWLTSISALDAFEAQFEYLHEQVICTLANRTLIMMEVNDPTVLVPEEGQRKDG